VDVAPPLHNELEARGPPPPNAAHCSLLAAPRIHTQLLSHVAGCCCWHRGDLLGIERGGDPCCPAGLPWWFLEVLRGAGQAPYVEHMAGQLPLLLESTQAVLSLMEASPACDPDCANDMVVPPSVCATSFGAYVRASWRFCAAALAQYCSHAVLGAGHADAVQSDRSILATFMQLACSHCRAWSFVAPIPPEVLPE
jgi:hypothetical protein